MHINRAAQMDAFALRNALERIRHLVAQAKSEVGLSATTLTSLTAIETEAANALVRTPTEIDSKQVQVESGNGKVGGFDNVIMRTVLPPKPVKP